MKRVLIVAALFVAISAQAQKKQSWPKEPDAVFGVAIGQVLENDRISECGGAKVEAEKNPISVCAMSRPGYGGFSIAGFPVPGFDGGFIQREDGVVTSILLNGKQSAYRDIKALLIERYGKPNTAKTERLQNKMGATFTSEVLFWSGQSVSLTLQERSGTVDETTAFFTSVSHARKKAQDRENDIKGSASKM